MRKNNKNKEANIISFKIDDKMSGINSYEANINNEWVLFEYDNKNKMIISILSLKKIS